MNIINEMKLKIPGKSVNEGFARSAVAAFAAQLDPTVAEIADIKKRGLDWGFLSWSPLWIKSLSVPPWVKEQSLP